MADQLAQTTAEAPKLYYQIYNDLQTRARQDRQFRFQVKQYANAQRQQRVGRFQQMKAANEAATGYQWETTSTGVRPRRDAHGKTIPTLQGEAAAYLNQGRAASAAATTARAKASTQNAATAARRADIAAKAEADRHAAEIKRIGVAQQNATTAAQRAAAQRARDAETARHHRATEQIARQKKTGGGGGGLIKPKKTGP